MEKTELKKILNRDEYAYLVDNNNFLELKTKSIFITGSNGSIGNRLQERLNQMNVKYIATDIDSFDITKQVSDLSIYDIIINIAGAKHAPKGEVDVEETLNVNTLGVLNLLKNKGDAKIVLTSTCKSCNPETVYGATKLLSERLVMNSGGSVARFYNVIETSGNVFEIWKQPECIDVVSDCNRYFISLDEAVGLLMYSCLNKGRFSVNLDTIHNMLDISRRLYPEKKKNYINPRRGDRVSELKYASNEQAEIINKSIIKINNYFDLT